MIILAINTKYKSKINKAYKAIRNYQEIVNLQGTCTTEKEELKLATKEEKAFNKYMELLEELPQREINNMQKQHKNLHGYNF
jgi:hypothetical protein